MRDKMSEHWRPFGYWALTLNTAFGFPVMAFSMIFRPELDWGALTGAYGALLAAWCAAAGIRQWGKHNGEQ